MLVSNAGMRAFTNEPKAGVDTLLPWHDNRTSPTVLHIARRSATFDPFISRTMIASTGLGRATSFSMWKMICEDVDATSAVVVASFVSFDSRVPNASSIVGEFLGDGRIEPSILYNVRRCSGPVVLPLFAGLMISLRQYCSFSGESGFCNRSLNSNSACSRTLGFPDFALFSAMLTGF